MAVPLKLNAIEQEHLQDVYDAAKVARDQLPYTPAFEQLYQDFQDRTFKNATREQVFGALLKYTRSSGTAPTPLPEGTLNEEQLKQLKAVLSRHAKGGKVLPYGDEYTAAKAEFTKAAGVDLPDLEFWQAILRAQGPKRKPPARTKVAATKEREEDEGDE